MLSCTPSPYHLPSADSKLQHILPSFLLLSAHRAELLPAPISAPDADSKLPHILLSSAFLVIPGAIAWGVDFLWRLYRQEAAEVASFLPALAGAGAGAGSSSSSSGSGSKDQRPRDETAAEARALAVLRASGQVEGEERGGTAAAALEQQAQAGTLKPFVELAYGESGTNDSPFTHVYSRCMAGGGAACSSAARSCTSCSRCGMREWRTITAHPSAAFLLACRLPAAGAHRPALLASAPQPGLPLVPTAAGYLPLVYTGTLAYYLDTAALVEPDSNCCILPGPQATCPWCTLAPWPADCII